MSDNTPRILTVLVEYSFSQKRVIVRGVWSAGIGGAHRRNCLEQGNIQNYVQVFEDIDMGFLVVFAGLVPEEE